MLATYGMLKSSLSQYKASDNKIRRMCDKNEIVKLTKNLYETDLNVPGYLVANAIYSPSYLSFDYALAYHGLIPERVYVYTSATFRKNKKKKYTNKIGTFTYCDVPAACYPYGIEIKEEGQYTYLIASAEKALCDKLYSLPPVKNKKELCNLLFEDLRIDFDRFNELDFDDLSLLCDLYRCTNLKLLMKVIRDLRKSNFESKAGNEKRLNTKL